MASPFWNIHTKAVDSKTSLIENLKYLRMPFAFAVLEHVKWGSIMHMHVFVKKLLWECEREG